MDTSRKHSVTGNFLDNRCSRRRQVASIDFPVSGSEVSHDAATMWRSIKKAGLDVGNAIPCGCVVW